MYRYTYSYARACIDTHLHVGPRIVFLVCIIVFLCVVAVRKHKQEGLTSLIHAYMNNHFVFPTLILRSIFTFRSMNAEDK